MQTVYIDTLLCVNLFIDYIILCIVKKALKINTKAIRLILGAAFASVCTLGVFLPFYTMLFSVFYKIITATLTVYIAFGKGKFKKILFRLMTFIGISIGFSGITVLIWLLLKPDGIVIYNDVVYFDISPVMLIVCTLISFISISIYERIKEKFNPKIKIHKVTISLDNSQYSFNSMVDTGCNLKEPFSGLPVIIAEKELINHKNIPKEKLRLVPYKTLSGEGVLKAFKPDKTLVDGKEIHNGCYIGISEQKLTNEIKSLMGKEITEGL